MSVTKKSYNKQTKFAVIIKMIKGEETVQQLCSQYGIHQSVLFKWKKAFMENGSDIFDTPASRKEKPPETDHLERKVG